MFEAIRSETQADLVELHVRWLARAAKAFDVPIVLSTVGVEYGFNSPTLPSIVAELDGIEPIDRLSMNAVDDDAFREAVEATGRKRLIIGGLHLVAVLERLDHRPRRSRTAPYGEAACEVTGWYVVEAPKAAPRCRGHGAEGDPACTGPGGGVGVKPARRKGCVITGIRNASGAMVSLHPCNLSQPAEQPARAMPTFS
jgi:hypothetical protein